MEFPFEPALGGGIAADFFIGEECRPVFSQGAETALDLARGRRAGGGQSR